MTDRELLEMAAKAIHTTENYANKAYMEGWFSWWNPLQRDTDALNLAVSIPGLNLQWIIAEAWQAHDTHEKRMEYVRRAIVRAAAAIGSAM